MSTIVSIVSYPFLPATTGGQKGIAVFYTFFSKYNKLICCTTKNNDPSCANFELRNFISDSTFRYINVFLFFSLRRMIIKENATHLLLEHPYYGWLGVLLKKATGVQLVVHSHNIEYRRWKALGKWWWPVLKAYEKFTHRHANFNFFKTDEDKAAAINEFGLHPDRCLTATYGIGWNAIPALAEKQACRDYVRQKHQLNGGTKIFLFNGSLDYAPNLQAVHSILEKINPLLLQLGKQYTIIICGKGLPAGLDELKAYRDQHIIYAGFVDDISVYFKGADAFINPVTEGGGIQTKLVEALAYDMDAVSTQQGAIGVPLSITGDKLTVVANNDWALFASAMLETSGNAHLPPAFFDHFYWDNIAQKAARFIAISF